MPEPIRAGMSEVIITGGGPVGLGLAIDLALKGVTSTVLERSESLHRIPKGQNLTQRTASTFVPGAFQRPCALQVLCHQNSEMQGW